LFLCTGNYYRSRFAEALFNALAEQHGLGWRAESRGLALERGVRNVGPISPHAARRLAELGIPRGSGRFPLSAVEADFAAADKIIALDAQEHRPLMVERFPRWADITEYWLVHDLDQSSVQAALGEIELRVRELVESLPHTDF
jgi:protein-tyrosine phosphatase